VTDTGCGVDPADVEMLFEPFVTKDKSKGTGLGLFLVKQQSRALGGECGLGPNPSGRGCEAWFEVAYEPVIEHATEEGIPTELDGSCGIPVAAIDYSSGRVESREHVPNELQIACGEMPSHMLNDETCRIPVEGLNSSGHVESREHIPNELQIACGETPSHVLEPQVHFAI